MLLRLRLILAILPALHVAVHAQSVFTLHWQATTISQGHPAFQAPYSGANSVSPEQEGKTSFTGTVFGGAALWPGGAVIFDPEASWGTGISNARGLAGFTNGETYRIGSSDFKLFVARLYLQQTFGFGGGRDTIADDVNQPAMIADTRRLTVTIGKFSVADFFDDNAYSHDARSQFMNWSLMSAGAWDYPADTRGYTIGAAAEWHDIDWSVRGAFVLEPTAPNGLELDMRPGVAHGLALEEEYRYTLGADSGTVRFMQFVNTSDAGTYSQAVSNFTWNNFISARPVMPMDAFIGQTRRDGTVKYGYGVNIEQQLSPSIGGFLRWSWNDGATETWAFTEIDRSLALGAEFKGRLWSRTADVAGAALVFNGLSDDHRRFLELGGHGFMIGDAAANAIVYPRALALNYSPESILELYYRWQPLPFVAISPDYQFIVNPAYNADRGPIHVVAVRVHVGM